MLCVSVSLWLFVILAGISHSADKIILKNNSVIEGKIIKEKDDQIIIELAGGKATMGIPRSDILKIIMEKPESFLKAEVAFKKRKFEEAIKLYNEVISLYGTTEWAEKALVRIGRAYMGLKKADKACETFERFLSKHKDSDLSCEVALILGKIYKDKGAYDKAKIFFREILKENYAGKYLAEAQFCLGGIYTATEEYEEALMSFLRIVVVFYKQIEFIEDAIFKSGFCYEKLEDFINAREIYEELLATYPKGKYAKEIGEKILEMDNKLRKEKKDEEDSFFACADFDWRSSSGAGRKG